MSDDGPVVGEAMHRRDVDRGVRCVFPCGLDKPDHVAGRESCCATVVYVHPVGCRRGDLASVEAGVGAHDCCPGLRIRGGLTCEVAGVEFGEGGIEVIEIEHDLFGHHPLAVDFGDLQRFNAKCGRFLEPLAAQTQAIAAHRDSRLRNSDSQGCDRTDVFDRGRAAIDFAAEALTSVIKPRVLGEQRTDLVKAIGERERDQAIVSSGRRVRQ